jgi:hypothetical protein
MKVEATIHFGNHGNRKRVSKPKPTVAGRTPRIAKLMALAIRFEGLIADGTVSGYSELAELAQVSRARITQIMNLLVLAPDIQESLLFLPQVKNGRDALTLAEMQSVALEFNWRRQRQNWKSLSAALGDVLIN